MSDKFKKMFRNLLVDLTDEELKELTDHFDRLPDDAIDEIIVLLHHQFIERNLDW